MNILYCCIFVASLLHFYFDVFFFSFHLILFFRHTCCSWRWWISSMATVWLPASWPLQS